MMRRLAVTGLILVSAPALSQTMGADEGEWEPLSFEVVEFTEASDGVDPTGLWDQDSLELAAEGSVPAKLFHAQVELPGGTFTIAPLIGLNCGMQNCYFAFGLDTPEGESFRPQGYQSICQYQGAYEEGVEIRREPLAVRVPLCDQFFDIAAEIEHGDADGPHFIGTWGFVGDGTFDACEPYNTTTYGPDSADNGHALFEYESYAEVEPGHWRIETANIYEGSRFPLTIDLHVDGDTMHQVTTSEDGHQQEAELVRC